ncbi:hypothetical protein PM082_009498 [Marasmius tenuissimus]|nr:hypothetical protein PM082_009498 [Marasmius tenuissimus]
MLEGSKARHWLARSLFGARVAQNLLRTDGEPSSTSGFSSTHEANDNPYRDQPPGGTVLRGPS